MHRKHKLIGREIQRSRSFVRARCHRLKSREAPLNGLTRKKFLKLIAEQQKCAVKDIVPRNVDLADVAKLSGMKEECLRSFWRSQGEKMCVRASLPRWKLEDSLALLKAIEDDDEEDEHCIDFKSIYERAFRGRVLNWEHLREHYNRVRRVVPFYMLKDLQSTVAAAIKAIKEKMDDGGEGGEIEGRNADDMELEDDEDDFIG